MFRLARVVLLAAVIFGLAAPAAGAVPPRQLRADLGALWTTVLQTPSAQNSFGTGGPQFACWKLDGTVAPFSPGEDLSCTVMPGTRIFVAGASAECSTFDDDHAGFGTTPQQLRACARQDDAQGAPPVTLDGTSLPPLDEVESDLLNIVLPADNVFGVPAGTAGQSVAHGWAALLDPLTPGTHRIVIHAPARTVTTTLTVKPDD